jgi:hypothetical protein
MYIAYNSSLLFTDCCVFSVYPNIVIMVVYVLGHRGRICDPFSKKI